MSKIKLLFICLLFISCLHFSLKANEVESSLYYLKLGVIDTPNDSAVLPNFGVGYRFQQDHYGLDLSANLSSIIFVNYASMKGLFLYYPQPEKKHQLYFGAGPGLGFHANFLPFGYGTSGLGVVTLEGIVGYEFRYSSHFKTFVQLELSQPVFGFGSRRRHCSYKPGIALTAGIGF